MPNNIITIKNTKVPSKPDCIPFYSNSSRTLPTDLVSTAASISGIKAIWIMAS